MLKLVPVRSLRKQYRWAVWGMLTGKEILTGPPGMSKDGSYIILALSEVLK